MKRAKLIAIAVLVIMATLATTTFSKAQPRRHRGARAGQRAIRVGLREQVNEWLAEELNLTEKEKKPVMLQVRKIMSLKRRSIPGLRKLKALKQNEEASAEDIAAGLKRFQNNLAEARAKIIREEKKLVDMEEMTPERELTLTILGILDNGRPLPRISAVRPRGRRRGPAERLGPARKQPHTDIRSVY